MAQFQARCGKRAVALTLVCCTLAHILHTEAAPFLVVFGDSLSDTGEAVAALSVQRVIICKLRAMTSQGRGQSLAFSVLVGNSFTLSNGTAPPPSRGYWQGARTAWHLLSPQPTRVPCSSSSQQIRYPVPTARLCA